MGTSLRKIAQQKSRWELLHLSFCAWPLSKPTVRLMPTLLARSQLDSPTVVLWLVLDTPVLDILDTLVLDILDMLVLDILDTLVLDTLVMPTRLLLLPLPMDTPVLLLPLLSTDTQILDTDMPDTTASVRLRPKPIQMLMLTLSLRSLLVSPSITPLLPDMPQCWSSHRNHVCCPSLCWIPFICCSRLHRIFRCWTCWLCWTRILWSWWTRILRSCWTWIRICWTLRQA